MNFKEMKIENCFADSETYEYLLPVDGKQMLKFLPDWDVRVNEKLRRPSAILQKDGVIIKCILAGNSFRVSFPVGSWAMEKYNFEQFLRGLPCIE